MVEIQVKDTDDVVVAAVDGGFISVALDRVSILSEHIELGDDIDVDKAQADLDEARAHRRERRGRARVRHAEAQLRAAEKVRQS